MAFTWASTSASLTLNVTAYAPIGAMTNLRKIPLIPDPDGSTAMIQSVLMGAGRVGADVQLTGYTTSPTDWQTLRGDARSFTSKTLTLHNGESGTYYIMSLESEERSVDQYPGSGSTGWTWYTAEFTEYSTST